MPRRSSHRHEVDDVLVEVTFCPREERLHNFNLTCAVRKKPAKLNINIKGEGFGVHARLLLEGEESVTGGGTSTLALPGGVDAGGCVGARGGYELSPLPNFNTIDFGRVYINDRARRKVTVVNPGKFNVDYALFYRASTSSGDAAAARAGGGGGGGLYDSAGGGNGMPSALSVTATTVSAMSGAAAAVPAAGTRSSGGGAFSLNGTVRRGERLELALEFAPLSEAALDGGGELVCALAMSARHTYVLRLAGRGAHPGLRFSFLRHDFGPCFVTPPGEPPAAETAVLRVANADAAAPLSLDCDFAGHRCLRVECAPAVIAPGAEVDIPIHFAPREAKGYAFSVPFLVNGSYTVKVVLLGEGCPARLELANPSQRHVSFGMVPAGATVTKVVRVVNRSKRAMALQLTQEGEDTGGGGAGSAGAGALAARSVTFSPAAALTLAPRQGVNVELTFAPRARLAAFSETLLVRAGAAAAPRALCAVSGQSVGMAVRLAQNALPFGTVCAGAAKTLRLALENEGDDPVRFAWDAATLGPHFTVAPMDGLAAPLRSVTFDVTFRPRAPHPDVRQEGITLVAASAVAAAGAAPTRLALACTGISVEQPEESVIKLAFDARVRQTQTQSVTLTNPTDRPWYIEPVVTGDHWSGDAQVSVPAKGSAQYGITFCPLAMTAAVGAGAAAGAATGAAAAAAAAGAAAAGAAAAAGGGAAAAGGGAAERPQVHRGGLFFPLPDGNGIMYAMTGTAGPPLAEGPPIELATPAKTPLSFAVPVRNWLRRPQRFDAAVRLGDGAHASTQLKGASTVEVPPLGAKQYALRFVAYKEGVTTAQVTFTCPHTGEYQFHDLVITAGEPEVQETIAMEASVRNAARHVITIDNPLPPSAAITLGSVTAPAAAAAKAAAAPDAWWQCSNRCVRLRQLGAMAGRHEGAFEIEYRPLLAAPGGTAEAVTLSFAIAELGTYKYALRLVATPPREAHALRFATALGAAPAPVETLAVRVFNGAEAAPFECRVERHPQFFRAPARVAAPALLPPGSAAAWDGQILSVPVAFEPEAPGDLEDTLVVTSPIFGTYRCALRGACGPPVPQGPFRVAPGGAARDVPFRNVFAAPQEFAFTVDNAAFAVVGGARATIPGKTARAIQVKYTAAAAAGDGSGGGGSSGGIVAAQLIVQCVGGANGGLPPWVFYLQGGE
ncbi:hypothetical protein JKP88DRAFT_256749 [Tribonema minus]|uniref:Uncharacterized protein n=1 Tax=Tribonema minus TaxID=303371 RepID=A0A835YMW6_9STRA|nr:hypothetical protein JKP88DRAFT_256749 [Tribonema minus]